MENEQQSRDEFMLWAADKYWPNGLFMYGPLHRRDSGEFHDDRAELGFQAWQAAKVSMLTAPEQITKLGFTSELTGKRYDFAGVHKLIEAFLLSEARNDLLEIGNE